MRLGRVVPPPLVVSPFLALAFVPVLACASRQPRPPQYLRATPVAEAPRAPAVIQVPTPMPLPGQLQRLPGLRPSHPSSPHSPHSGQACGLACGRASGSAQRDRRQTWEVIDDANRKAAAGPERDAYFNAIMTFDYSEGALYQVYTAPLRLTAIQLQPGEKIVGKPAAGDTLRWVMGVGRSGVDAGEQQHLYVKPTRPGLQTTLVINTDRRTYYLELHSFDETYMAAVRWRYPQDEIAHLEGAAARQEALARTTTATNVNLEAVNFGYRISVEKGKPRWTPVQVFDDGRKTFIRFPAAMLTREAPALFVLSSTNETQLVNYRVKNDTYVVDRLIERAELRLGQKDQEIVRVARAR